MTIANLKEAAEAVKAVEQLNEFRQLLDQTTDGAEIEMFSRCGVKYHEHNDITVNQKAIDSLKIMLDAFIDRYTSKFSELGLALEPTPDAPKHEELKERNAFEIFED